MRILPASLGISFLLLCGCWASGTSGDEKPGASAADSEATTIDGVDDPAAGEQAEPAEESPDSPVADEADKGSPPSADSKPAAPTPDLVTAQEIQSAFLAHVEGFKKEGDGLLRLFDDRSSEDLVLEFKAVVPGARKVEGRGYLVEASFAVKGGEDGQLYDLHFWLNFRTDRDDKAEATALDVTDVRIFRVPRKAGGAWTMEARYDIATERPVAVK